MTQPPNEPKDLTARQQVLLGACLSVAAIVVAFACGTGTQSLPMLVQCQLDALKILPDDPKMATVYDVADIVERVRACHRQHPDAGR